MPTPFPNQDHGPSTGPVVTGAPSSGGRAARRDAARLELRGAFAGILVMLGFGAVLQAAVAALAAAFGTTAPDLMLPAQALVYLAFGTVSVPVIAAACFLQMVVVHPDAGVAAALVDSAATVVAVAFAALAVPALFRLRADLTGLRRPHLAALVLVACLVHGGLVALATRLLPTLPAPDPFEFAVDIIGSLAFVVVVAGLLHLRAVIRKGALEASVRTAGSKG
jgi:hypothetical protein